MFIYLDNNATTPLREEVKAGMLKALDVFGNPSALYRPAQEARMVVDEVRRKVSELLNVRAEQVVFTSGGTESNNMALKGLLHGKGKLLMGATEHASVRVPAQKLDAEIIPVNEEGEVNLQSFEQRLQKGDVEVVSLMYVNSETGVIHPIKEVGEICAKHGVKFHVDAVQAVGKMKVDFPALHADALSLSFHKFGGPKGIGALVVKNEVEMTSLIAGGAQERNRRAGTENVVGIAGAGQAVECALQHMEKESEHLLSLHKILEEGIHRIHVGARIIAESAPRIHTTTDILLPNIEAQTVVMALDMENICVSNGSACSSGRVEPSDVLLAMGYSEQEAICALRVSLGWHNTEEDVKEFLNSFEKVIKRLKN